MKILIVNPFGIGDVIFSFAVAEAVKAFDPSIEVDYVCNERTDELVAMNPSVRKRFVFNRGRFRRLLKEGRRAFVSEAWALFEGVRSERYSAAFDLSLGKEYAFFLKLAGIRRRIGFDYKGRGFFLTDKVKIAGFEGMPVRERYAALLDIWKPGTSAAARYPELRVLSEKSIVHSPLSIGDHPSSSIDHRPWTIDRAASSRPLIVIAPGGGRSWGPNAHYKQWGASRFAETARSLAGRGARVVLMGDEAEKSLCEEVRDGAGLLDAAVLAGASLGEAARVLRSADLFIGNDGGLLHLADILGVPLVGIYGPVDETAYGPRGGNFRHVVITENVECRPCYKSFRFGGCAFNKRCLDNIPVSLVLAASERLLKMKLRVKSEK